MALLVLVQMDRTVVQHRHIGIPLDIFYFRIAGQQGIHRIKNEIPHLGVGKVKYCLRATARRNEVLSGDFHHPVGMLLV